MILVDPGARPVIGHRGASRECPENTMAAFRRAVELGVDAIEYDVRLSRDGRAVVFHDETLDRTTDGSGPVRSLGLEALQELDAGTGQRIPTLEEVLGEFGELPQIIEVKEARASAAVLDAIRRHDVGGHVLVGSFERRALNAFAHSQVPTSASRPGVAFFFAASRMRVALRGAYRAFCVPERSGSLQLVDERFVGCAARAGKPVHVWTVDDPDRAAALRRIGVAGIITNDPARMVHPG